MNHAKRRQFLMATSALGRNPNRSSVTRIDLFSSGPWRA